jgi:hypothetical protein
MSMEHLMKAQTEKFIELLVEDIIDVEDFYAISITPTRIRLQGEAKLKAIERYKDDGWKFFLDESCTMMNSDKDGIYIILTF